MEEFPVKVYIYDLSKGLARSLSMPLLGKQIDGIWHTGIVVYGQEFFFGGSGIESCDPCGTVLGQPDSIVDLGVTQVPYDMMMEYLSELSSTTFRPDSYHLLEHNCNTFSNEIANFLTGNNIPAYVTNLPQEVLSTPFGSMIRPFIDSMSVRPSGGHSIFSQNAATGDSKSSSKKETSAMPKASEKSNAASINPTTSAKVTFMPIKYNDKQVLQRYDQAKSKLSGNCSNEDMKLIEETAEFVTLPANKCTWSIGPDHLQVLARVIENADHSDDERCAVAGLLQLAMLSEDVVGLVTHDRRHSVMSLLHNMAHINQSNALRIVNTKMMVNLSSEQDGLKWLMSEESRTKDKDNLCNMSITMNACLSSLLSENADVRNAAVALTANFSQHKNLNEECSIELGSALIECLRKSEDRVTKERCLAALTRCVQVSPEVAALVKVMAVDLDTYEKMSELAKGYTQAIRAASQSLPI